MNETSPETEYLIPRPVRQGYEFVPGWGIVQVVAVLIGLAAGILIAAILHLLRAPVLVQVFPIAGFGGLGVVVAKPLMDGSTVLDLLISYRAWAHKTKRYLYDWARDDITE
ncbi:MAG: hypothetical protein M0Z41_13800 [Peptococcaceae bacterium]|nr:hypothetical protein [Peptococcaceae bacterium]